MLITRSRLSSTRDIRLFISFREAMADVQRFDLLDPAEVARFGGIEIVAEGVVEGFLSGIHRSPFRGFSVEFTEHRAYQPGDERSEEHTSELQSRGHLVCRLLLEK